MIRCSRLPNPVATPRINAAISSEMIIKLRTQYADIAKNETDMSSKYGGDTRWWPMCARSCGHPEADQRRDPADPRQHQDDYGFARSREASLQQSLDQLQGVSTSSGQAQVRLRELQREAEANRTLYE